MHPQRRDASPQAKYHVIPLYSTELSAAYTTPVQILAVKSRRIQSPTRGKKYVFLIWGEL